ncbi:hypothetical protein J8N05_07880 [Streptomyces sp. BH-SS-21]|uniref:Uncharacterized protein n=1 Tax=Streptomyces liliiviolaceus TaxID=2823109 RepID=A0A940XX09_9ACTN|nr:hypothetical protein [Streptomyces liliiviolaceus]MBQ0848130.1 hypothetical protein [Streptomyces liliiviolaceus]
MTSYVTRYLAQPGTSITTLTSWDGRPTGAFLRQGEVLQLLWLVWDLSPQYEIWLRVPVHSWAWQGFSEPDLMAEFVVKHASGEAVVEAVGPARGGWSAVFLAAQMPVTSADSLAIDAARALADAKADEREPAPNDFSELVASLALA